MSGSNRESPRVSGVFTLSSEVKYREVLVVYILLKHLKCSRVSFELSFKVSLPLGDLDRDPLERIRLSAVEDYSTQGGRTCTYYAIVLVTHVGAFGLVQMRVEVGGPRVGTNSSE